MIQGKPRKSSVSRQSVKTSLNFEPVGRFTCFTSNRNLNRFGQQVTIFTLTFQPPLQTRLYTAGVSNKLQSRSTFVASAFNDLN
jgi:hypothetical protein